MGVGLVEDEPSFESWRTAEDEPSFGSWRLVEEIRMPRGSRELALLSFLPTVLTTK